LMYLSHEILIGGFLLTLVGLGSYELVKK